MTRTNIFAAVALAAAVVSGPALADTTYYGTADNFTVGKEQNNADAAPVGAGQTANDRGFVTERTYGAPTVERSTNADDAGFIGTRFFEQDTANANNGR